MKLSVVIVNFNSACLLSSCLDAVFREITDGMEVIVVDNASGDGSAGIVRERYPKAILVRNTTNRGFAGGANDGFAVASGDLLVLLNTDVILREGYIMEILRASAAYPGYAMFASKMSYPDGRINSAGIGVSLSGAAWDRGKGDTDTGQYENEEEIFGPCGGAAVYRRLLIDAAGGFDEDFFLFMEDVDLAFRARLLGFRCRYLPQARVYHHHGVSTGIGSDLSVYYGNRNIIWYPVKDYPLMLLILAFPFLVGRMIGVTGYYAVTGRGRVVIRSKQDGVSALPSILRKRRKVMSSAGISGVARFIRLFASP